MSQIPFEVRLKGYVRQARFNDPVMNRLVDRDPLKIKVSVVRRYAVRLRDRLAPEERDAKSAIMVLQFFAAEAGLQHRIEIERQESASERSLGSILDRSMLE